jgi:hypothetical protein
MAWVTAIEVTEGEGKIQPTQVTAVAKIFQTMDSSRILQIDTHGSVDREKPGKQSQTLQFGRESAKQLFDLLKETYGFE